MALGALIFFFAPLITNITFRHSKKSEKKPFFLKDPKQLIVILRICGFFYVLVGVYSFIRSL